MDNVTNFLVPVHKRLSKEEADAVLVKYSLKDTTKLPKIKLGDVALAELGCEVGDVVEISRDKSFAGSSIKYYRVVIE